jgi:hypothetical protein
MGVPAHDSRDADLAQVCGLPVVNVIAKSSKSDGGDDVCDDVLENSAAFDGMRLSDARVSIGAELKVSSVCMIAAAMCHDRSADAGIGPRTYRLHTAGLAHFKAALLGMPHTYCAQRRQRSAACQVFGSTRCVAKYIGAAYDPAHAAAAG